MQPCASMLRPLITAVFAFTLLGASDAAAAVVASYSTSMRQLVISGSDGPDEIVVGRDAAGSILVNGGTVASRNGRATAGDTLRIEIQSGAGDDVVMRDATRGSLPRAFIYGGAGNDLLIGGDSVDVLRGGAGNDVLIGGRGNDVVLGQDGDDLLIWNNGDGSDFLEGGEGFDFVQVNGSNTAGDDFPMHPNGDRVRLQRNNLALFTLDIGTVEVLDVNGQGGSDVIVGSVGPQGLPSLYLDGGEGNDLLAGGSGVDLLLGISGHDTLVAGNPDDRIVDDGDDRVLSRRLDSESAGATQPER